MIQKLIMMCALCSVLSGCFAGLILAGGTGYVVGRELEEEQGTKEPEVYK